MTTFWLVCGSRGEYYSDRAEWRVALYESEERARAVAEAAKEIARANEAAENAWQRLARPRGVFGPLASPLTLPPKPVPKPNLFDPEFGVGEEYWVEKVEVRE